MEFAWDGTKSEENLAERGFDFEFATLIFDGPTPERADTREDYGEKRVVAIGMAQSIHLTVVYTDRTQSDSVVRRIISARRSNRNERKAYQEAVGLD